MLHGMSGPWSVPGPLLTRIRHMRMLGDMTNQTTATSAPDTRIYLGATYRNLAGTTVRPFGVSQYACGVCVAYQRTDGRGPMLTAHVNVFRARFTMIGAR